eukprot:GHVR01110843.1.p1 GENE.GHVR01110843.1~~GHVR01110843.1.p1  ORF type:complete len:111 (+),score=10.49 GHVR01110843.1:79-411(+)
MNELCTDSVDMYTHMGNNILSNILCCECGTSIQPNPSMMCPLCLRSRVDISVGVSKQVVLSYCKDCNRYMKPPWVVCEPESKELLALCLKKIKGLTLVHILYGRSLTLSV